jgi:tubulin polyglutamylase TTLL6/13
MQLLGRKNLLGRSLARVKRICPEDWGFVPDTWMLPFQGTELLREAEKYRTLIVKPEASCQGRGIFLCSDVSEI